jgi:predicted membrane protein
MDKASGLREALLKQMDKNQGGSSNHDAGSILAILAKDTNRFRRLRRATVLSWVLLAASFLGTGIVGALTGFRTEVWIIIPVIGVQALLILAVSCTFVLSIRSRTLRMKQIQATLSDIHEQLKRLAEAK